MHRNDLLVFLLLATLLAVGCQEDLAMPPAYVLVEGFELSTPGVGGGRGDITEVWAFAGDEYLGAFPLPARIPVYLAGPTDMRFQPGVRRNGIRAQPDQYEFYEAPRRTLDLTPGQSIGLGTLPTGYRSDVRFGFVESFEPGASRVFTESIEGTELLGATVDCVSSGERSGRLLLTEANATVAIASDVAISDLFTERPYVWLEVDVKSDAPVVWGVMGMDAQGFPVREFDPGSRPTEEWTKIYFELTEVIAAANVETLRVFFFANLPEGATEAEVFLDNVRLLYF